MYRWSQTNKAYLRSSQKVKPARQGQYHPSTSWGRTLFQPQLLISAWTMLQICGVWPDKFPALLLAHLPLCKAAYNCHFLTDFISENISFQFCALNSTTIPKHQRLKKRLGIMNSYPGNQKNLRFLHTIVTPHQVTVMLSLAEVSSICLLPPESFITSFCEPLNV